MSKLETLQDNFDDSNFDYSKWDSPAPPFLGLFWNESTSLEVFLDSSGKAFTLASNSSLGTFTLQDSFVSIKVDGVNASSLFYFRLDSGSNQLYFYIAGGNIQFIKSDSVSGVYSTTAAPYAGTGYLGMREYNGMIYAYTSPDGSTWTEIGQTTYSTSFDTVIPLVFFISLVSDFSKVIRLNDFNRYSIPAPVPPKNPRKKLRGKGKLRGSVRID